MKETLSKILDIVSKVVAVLLVFAFLLYYINLNYHFMPELGETILNFIFHWGALILTGIVAVEAVIKRNIVITIIFLVLIAAVVVFMFFPGTIESFLPKKN